MSDVPLILALHQAYQDASRMELALTQHRIRAWRRWLAHAESIGATWGVKQLQGVIAWIHRGIRTQARKPGSLRFRNLVENPDNFEEELAFARTDARRAKGRPMRQAIIRVATPEGIVERRLTGDEVSVPAVPPEPPSAAVAEALRRFRENGLKISTAAEIPAP